jgi:DNA-binding IclR family transcriptional regulator
MSSLERGLDVLELLVPHGDGLPLSAIAQRLHLPKSGAHRLLATLVQRGYLRQDPRSQHYGLSLRIAALGFEVLAASRIPDVCQPVLHRLAAASGELVRLTVVEDDGLTWIARAQGAQYGLRYDPEMGTRATLHVTAVGQAWLATLPEDQALRLALAQPGFGELDRYGPTAARSAAAVLDKLAATRARGWGMVVDEAARGTAAMAMVVRDGTAPAAAVVGTVSIAGPSIRHTAERMAALAPELAAAAAELTRLWPMRRLTAPLADMAPDTRPMSTLAR